MLSTFLGVLFKNTWKHLEENGIFGIQRECTEQVQEIENEKFSKLLFSLIYTKMKVTLHVF